MKKYFVLDFNKLTNYKIRKVNKDGDYYLDCVLKYTQYKFPEFTTHTNKSQIKKDEFVYFMGCLLYHKSMQEGMLSL